MLGPSRTDVSQTGNGAKHFHFAAGATYADKGATCIENAASSTYVNNATGGAVYEGGKSQPNGK